MILENVGAGLAPALYTKMMCQILGGGEPRPYK